VPTVQVNGVELYYELTGEGGDPLVLVHGSWVDHTTFDLVRPILSQGFRVLAYDRRGHGRSERRPGRRTIADDVADLAALLEHLDLFPIHVAGSSLGGSVAIHLAATRPDLFRSLLSHEAPLTGLVDRPEAQLERALEAMAEVTRKVLEGDARGAARTFVDAVALGDGAWDRLAPGVQENLVANAPSWPDEYYDRSAVTVDPAALAEFYSPVLLTTGANSPAFFQRLSERLAGQFPNAELRVLPGTGHVPHLTHPALYAGTLVQFCLERSVPST
jgi:pimeloyl-ACP methyl ester carboxylesterase